VPSELVIAKRFGIATAWPGEKGALSGRNWEVLVGVTGVPDSDSGMIVSLSDIKTAMQPVLAKVDHWHLTESSVWDAHPSMTTWLQWWWDEAAQALAPYQCHLHHVYVSSAYEGGWVSAKGGHAFRWSSVPLDTPLAPIPVRIRYPEWCQLPDLTACSPLEWVNRLASCLPWGCLLIGDRGYEWGNGTVYLEQWQEWGGGHRLHRTEWSDEKNHAVFGVCTRRHGHTFRVGMTVPLSESMPQWVPDLWADYLWGGTATLEAFVAALATAHPHVVRWRVHETEGNRVSYRVRSESMRNNQGGYDVKLVNPSLIDG